MFLDWFSILVCSSRRFLKSRLPDYVAMTSPLGLCRLLLGPLQTVLNGRCFTAKLAKSSGQVPRHCQRAGGSRDIVCRYIATRFKVLGDHVGRLTVIFILHNQLWGRPSENLYINPEKKLPEESHAQLGICEKQVQSESVGFHPDSSVLSSFGSTTAQQSQHVFLESASGTQAISSVRIASQSESVMSSTSSRSLPCPKPTTSACVYSHSQSSASENSLSQDTYSPLNSDLSRLTGTWGDEDDNVTERAFLRDDIVDELMSTWGDQFDSEPTKSVQRCNSHSTLHSPASSLSTASSSAVCAYDETLPDSESFLEEFQCEFEQSTLQNSRASNSSFTFTPTATCSSMIPTPHQSKLLNSRAKKSRCPSACAYFLPKIHSISAPPRPRLVTPLSLQLTPAGVDKPQISPELFSRSFTFSGGTESAITNENISPELFGSPTPEGPPIVPNRQLPIHVSAADTMHACTPAMGRHFRSIPKRIILKSTQSSSDTPTHSGLVVHSLCRNTPLSERNDRTDTSSCFSPELFS